jgi:hypothetical protein
MSIAYLPKENAEPDEPAIVIDHLTVRYRRKTAVDGLSLRVPRGSSRRSSSTI